MFGIDLKSLSQKWNNFAHGVGECVQENLPDITEDVGMCAIGAATGDAKLAAGPCGALIKDTLKCLGEGAQKI